jgi:hypothetical protein
MNKVFLGNSTPIKMVSCGMSDLGNRKKQKKSKQALEFACNKLFKAFHTKLMINPEFHGFLLVCFKGRGRL